MVVTKDLLARYKEMKAQGKSITLAELRAQMEQEEQSSGATNSISSDTSNNLAKPQTGFAALSNSNSKNITSSNNTTVSNSDTFSTVQNNVNIDHQPYAGNLDSNILFQNSTPEVLKFALIGYPLGHSLSTFIHGAGFKSIGVNAKYEILETPPEDLVTKIKYMKSNGYSGFNITIPLKIPVILFLDDIDPMVEILGAVNTVVINNDLTLKGYNTDVLGFERAIPTDITLVGKTAGVLGTGGAARAAIVALVNKRIKKINLYTRNIPNCSEFLKGLRFKFPNVEFNAYQIERLRDLSEINILVNTTPIGMYGKSYGMTPVEENVLKTLPNDAIVYDVIYNPKRTQLLNLALKLGYRTINGVDMFINQAVAAEEIWLGKTPDFKDMKIAALENL